MPKPHYITSRTTLPCVFSNCNPRADVRAVGHSSTPVPLPTGLQRTLSAGTGSGIEEVLLLRFVPENDCACATAERPYVVQDGERVIMSQAGARRRWPADVSLVSDADRARSLTICRNPALHTAGPPAQANLQTKVARQRATQLPCLHSWRALLCGWSLRGRRGQTCLHPWPIRLVSDSHPVADSLRMVFLFSRRPSLS